MDPRLKKIKLFIHGTCTAGRFGPGGWACRLLCVDVAADVFGSDPKTSENRMFLRAAIEGFRALKQRCFVTAYTDSEYLYKGVTMGLPKWKTNGWQTQTGEVKNQALWQELGEAAAQHVVRWWWIKSGAPDFPEHELCAKLAVDAAAQQISSPLIRKPAQPAAPETIPAPVEELSA